MGRPAKTILSQSGNVTKEEIIKRHHTEIAMRGNTDKIEPSSRLNANQKKIFRYIVSELEAAKILGNMDTYLLETMSIAIDRLQAIEKMINQDFELIRDRELMAAKSKYTLDFNKGIDGLSMSPMSRAKFGIIAANKKEDEQDPLLKVLKRKAT